MENEEKNIQENIEETKEEQLDSMFNDDIEETQENIITEETEKIEELHEESMEPEEKTEEVSEVFQTQEESEILPEEIKEDFSFLNEITKEESKNISEQKPIETVTNEELVTFADDFEQENANEGLITVRPIKFQQFEQTPPNRAIKKNLDIMQDISMHISVELGRTKSSIREVMEMEQGTVVELEKIAGEQVEIFVNDKLVAKGEVIVIEDKFGVRITSTNIQKQI